MRWKTVAVAVAAWEGWWWLSRQHRRDQLYAEAKTLAQSLGKKLVVVGAPDRGATSSPASADDIVLDLGPSKAPNFIQCDICKRIPLPDDSCVVFVSCVLEYVADVDAALAELHRISGGRVYAVCVEPWTLTAYLYPDAKRTLGHDLRPTEVDRVSLQNR
jgi:SAM-dependent methyltransferase